MNAERRTHDRAIELAAREIDRPLDRAERDELEQHLATCPACSRGVATMRHHAVVLAGSFAPLPPRRVNDAVMAALLRQPARSQRLLVLATATALLLVALLGVAAAGSFIARNWLRPPQVVVPSPPAVVVDGSPSPMATVAPSPTSEPTAAPTAIPRDSTEPSLRPSAAPEPAGLPAGWRHELTCDDMGSNCRVHLLDGEGAEQPGWPIDVAGTCWDYGLTTGPDGTVFVACDTDARRVAVAAFEPSGQSVPGWPVTTEGRVTAPNWNDFGIGCGTLGQAVDVSPDGTVFVAVARTASQEDLTLASFSASGEARSGWPVAVAPGGCPGFSITGDRTVVGWWYEGLDEGVGLRADRTRYTVIGPDGTTLAGWPITSIGAASGPVVATDGSIFYTSATGNVWGHDQSGAIIDGFPYLLSEKAAPVLAPDGRILLFVRAPGVGPDEQSTSIVALTQKGSVVSGWPYQPAASAWGSGCATPSVDYVPFAFGADGTLYLPQQPADASSRGGVVALDRHGAVVAGWPFRLEANAFVTRIEAQPGQIVAWTWLGRCGEDGPQDGPDGGGTSTVIPLSVDGSPAR